MAVLSVLSLCLLFLLLSSVGGQSGNGKTSSEAAKDDDKRPAAGDDTPANTLPNSDDNDAPTDLGPPTNVTEPTTDSEE